MQKCFNKLKKLIFSILSKALALAIKVAYIALHVFGVAILCLVNFYLLIAIKSI